jgi:hypothetical protein
MDKNKWSVCFIFIKLAAFSFTVIDAFSSKLLYSEPYKF